MRVVCFKEGSLKPMLYHTVSDAASAVGVKAATISKAIKNRMPYLGYSYAAEEDWDGKPFAFKKPSNARSIIGITPDGHCVRFESIMNASETLNLHRSGIRLCCLGERRTCGGWSFRNDDPSIQCEDITPEMIATARHYKPRRTAEEIARDKAAKEEVIDTRKPLKIGYYEQGCIPSICPICGMVLGVNILTHLKQCLEGHEWAQKGKYIYVYD